MAAQGFCASFLKSIRSTQPYNTRTEHLFSWKTTKGQRLNDTGTRSASHVRKRLNVIGGLEGDAYTDEVSTEETALQTEYGDLERRHRSAIMAEPGETIKVEPDREMRERIEAPRQGQSGELPSGRAVRQTRRRSRVGAAGGRRDRRRNPARIVGRTPTPDRATGRRLDGSSVGLNLDPQADQRAARYPDRRRGRGRTRLFRERAPGESRLGAL